MMKRTKYKSKTSVTVFFIMLICVIVKAAADILLNNSYKPSIVTILLVVFMALVSFWGKKISIISQLLIGICAVVNLIQFVAFDWTKGNLNLNINYTASNLIFTVMLILICIEFFMPNILLFISAICQLLYLLYDFIIINKLYINQINLFLTDFNLKYIYSFASSFAITLFAITFAVYIIYAAKKYGFWKNNIGY